MKPTTPNISAEQGFTKTLNRMRSEFLEIKHDKNNPERSEKISKYIHEIAKFVDKIDKHYEQQHKNKKDTKEKNIT